MVLSFCLFLLSKFLLYHYANALCVQITAREVSVVGLVVHLECKVPVWCKEVLQCEVAYEVLCVGIDIVTVTELPVEDKSVVEHSSA